MPNGIRDLELLRTHNTPHQPGKFKRCCRNCAWFIGILFVLAASSTILYAVGIDAGWWKLPKHPSAMEPAIPTATETAQTMKANSNTLRLEGQRL